MQTMVDNWSYILTLGETWGILELSLPIYCIIKSYSNTRSEKENPTWSSFLNLDLLGFLDIINLNKTIFLKFISNRRGCVIYLKFRKHKMTFFVACFCIEKYYSFNEIDDMELVRSYSATSIICLVSSCYMLHVLLIYT